MYIPSYAQQFEYYGDTYSIVSTTDKTVKLLNCTFDPSSWIHAFDRFCRYNNEDYTVVSIGSHVFGTSYPELTAIQIPNNIESIDDGAFEECPNLKSVYLDSPAIVEKDYLPGGSGGNIYTIFGRNITEYVIGETPTKIGNWAFAGLLPNEVRFTIGLNVKSIGDYSFYSTTITSITLPHGVTSIGNRAFGSCTNLASINIPSSVTTIGDGAFSSSGISYLYLPHGVISIGSDAFAGCISLNYIYIPSSITSIGNNSFSQIYIPEVEYENIETIFNINYGNIYSNPIGSVDRPKKLLIGGEEITELVIPDDVTEIMHAMFQGVANITSVVIPNSVTSIGNGAFVGCLNLSNVTIGSGLTNIGFRAFGMCPNLVEFTCLAQDVPNITPDPLSYTIFDRTNCANGTLYVPNASVNAYKAAAQWNKWGTITGINESLGVLNLEDGNDYTNTSDKICESLTFSKTFSASAVNKWNAFYVPMKIDVEDYSGELDFAQIYAFCATVDTNGDGIVDADDENYLFVRPVKTGYISPNIPYLIRPREAKTYVINSADNILYKSEEGQVEFSTTLDKFTVTGLNEAFTVTAGDNNYFVTGSGNLSYRTSGSTTVKANRWVMHRESKQYGTSNSGDSEAREFAIIAIGEDMDDVTAIEMINRVEKVTVSGIYTLDGRKVDATGKLPAGLYIKDGKKYIIK